MADKEWADVFAPFDERVKLNNKALFFIPTAYPRLDPLGITPASINTWASAPAERAKLENPIGVSAIRKIMNCEPIAYVRATTFISVVNSMLESRSIEFRFATSDIVACVFKIPSFKKALADLGIKAETVAKACGIKTEIVENATSPNYRLSLRHAMKIRSYLSSLPVPENIKCEAHSRDIKEFITAHSRNGDVVQLARDEKSNLKNKPYFYERADLEAAEKNGHPWAIE